MGLPHTSLFEWGLGIIDPKVPKFLLSTLHPVAQSQQFDESPSASHNLA